MAKYKRYKLYNYGEYVGEGTIPELAEMTGLNISTMYTYRSKNKKSNKYRLDQIDNTPIEIDIEKIKESIEKEDYSQRDLASLIGLHPSSLVQKLKGKIEFTPQEVRHLELIFRLPKNELILNKDTEEVFEKDLTGAVRFVALRDDKNYLHYDEETDELYFDKKSDNQRFTWEIAHTFAKELGLTIRDEDDKNKEEQLVWYEVED